MPFIDLQTNLEASAFSEEFMKKLCSCTAAALGKPEDPHFTFGERWVPIIFDDDTQLDRIVKYLSDFLNTFSAEISNMVSSDRIKYILNVMLPERMNVVVKPGLPILIAGSCSPCVMLSVSAIGVTDTADKNKEHSAKIFEFLTRELGLTEDRIVIQFHALQPHQVGKKGTVMSFL